MIQSITNEVEIIQDNMGDYIVIEKDSGHYLKVFHSFMKAINYCKIHGMKIVSVN